MEYVEWNSYSADFIKEIKENLEGGFLKQPDSITTDEDLDEWLMGIKGDNNDNT